MTFKSGQEVELNQTWTHTSYGPSITITKGTRIGLISNTVAQNGEVFWLYMKDGVTGLVAIPETVLSKINKPVGPIKTDSKVYYWAYNEKGQPISIEIPRDRFNLNDYKVTIMED